MIKNSKFKTQKGNYTVAPENDRGNDNKGQYKNRRQIQSWGK